ncbi:hypothetical protein PPTG_24088 [Phytophthora nicotianae INRA-310]|uniref:Uncharacterized protein n=2 Tax=Phytophthora nicotianae TaxID=4792 RepID=W2PLA4_PHYN3|nr:hypothetical protein PPTG_24088 [Phytophthora nicotianae INRA-310]ETN01401.1 hypothetical protein PPTG_24088 [Phytophthora nicotianae INRA-310]
MGDAEETQLNGFEESIDANQKGDVNERRMEHFRQPCNDWVVDTVVEDVEAVEGDADDDLS